MPDTFIRFSDMKDSHPSPIDGANDLLAIAHKDQTSATGYTSMTTTPNALGAHAVEDQTFVNFQTTAKTVEGAINELAQGGGGGGSSTLAGLTDVDITSPSNNQVLKYNSTSQKWENGAGGGSSGDHITLTQAEYDALVEAGTVDPDAFYFISDAVMPAYSHQYSTSEQIVGTWVDGSPVYEKTIYNAGGVTGNFSFPHGIANFDKLLSYEGTVSDSSFAQYGDIRTVPRIASDGNSIGIDKVSTSSIFIINPNAFGTRLIDWYITIRYTKTAT